MKGKNNLHSLILVKTNKQKDMLIVEEKEPLYPLVMLVDDSTIDNFVNKKIISRYQFSTEVISFNRSREALGYLVKLNGNDTEQVPSILFLDLDMPEIDGNEFLQTFELLSDRLKKNITIVILTSSIDPADAEKFSRHKLVLTFLNKPLIKDNLEKLNLMLLKKNLKLVK